MQKSMRETRSTTKMLVEIGLIAGMYTAVTLLLAPFSFGPVQIRLSELFNYTALIKRRYIYGVTLGVLIANMASPTWLLDVPIGTIGTFVCLIIARWLADKTQKTWLKLTIFGAIFVVSMFTVAGQISLMGHVPFWPTYLTVAIGEAISMAIGGVLMAALLPRLTALAKAKS